MLYTNQICVLIVTVAWGLQFMHLNVSSKKDGTLAHNLFLYTVLMFTRAFWLVAYMCPYMPEP